MVENHSNIVIYFVIKSDYQSKDEVSLDMQQAFKNAVDWSVKSQWIKESECEQIDNQVKGQVFVFEEFKGEVFFNFLKSHRNSRVIGPKCLLTCFMEQVPIPFTRYPIYNMVMRGLIITTSNMSAESKNAVEKLVGFMGGDYNNLLTTSTTHLVVDSVLSEKYFKAYEQGIEVMKANWVEYVWKASMVTTLKATESDIINKFKCPLFYNLRFTASSLSEKEKNTIRKAVNSNGGIYTQELTKATNVLIVPYGRGEKFKYAERWKVKCLNPLWIEQCLEKGFAVPYQDYLVCSDKKCSTPVKSMHANMASLLDKNDSEISVIPSVSGKTVINESAPLDIQGDDAPVYKDRASDVFKTPNKGVRENYSSAQSDNALSYPKILDNISMSDIKKCGPLLDGCKVFLAGFNINQEEKLRRILNYCGAMRFTELNESVTHVIIGNPDKNDAQSIKDFPNKPHIVTLGWLSNSIKKGCLEKESNCAYSFANAEQDTKQILKNLQQPSPLSKKGLQILDPIRVETNSSQPLVTIDPNLIEKYSHSENSGCSSEKEQQIAQYNSVDKQESIKQQTLNSSPSDKLFSGLNFAITGSSPNATEDIKKTILEFGGSVASNSRAVIDYTIVPVTNMLTNIRSEEVVTSIWVEECLYENRIVETKYYHRPIPVPDFGNNKPLEGCVITFSSYNISEKQYLETVASFLGAVCQDVLSKKNNPQRRVARTTHLICASPLGVKYNAALKWNLPTVDKNWLMKCFRLGKIIAVDSFLLNKSENVVNVTIHSAEASKKLANKIEFPVNGRAGPELSTGSVTKITDFRVPEISAHDTPAAPSTHNTNHRSPTNFTCDSKRITYITPSIADSNASVERNYRLRSTKETRELPTGLLKKINNEASSSVKRKISTQNSNLEAARVGSPKNKVPRLDTVNVTSSLEEVGWQDTLTDINHNQGDHSANSSDQRARDKSVERVAENAKISSVLYTENDKHKKVSDVNAEISRVPLLTSKHPITAVPIQGNNDMEKSSVDINKKNLLSLNRRDRTNELFRSTTKTNWNMLISIANNERKQQCDSIIRSLGGRVLPTYEPDCPEEDRATHLIIDDLKKTEKLLCSVASGLWVLHSSYLDHCQKCEKFMEEEQFEWGNPFNALLQSKAVKEYELIAKAAYRWRKTIQKEGLAKRPFVGMKAVIISSSDDDSVQPLIRVVKSGGGIVLQQSDILKATHCLIRSLKNINNVPVKLNVLAAKGIHLLLAVYLSDYLTIDPPPRPELCYPDIYKRCF